MSAEAGSADIPGMSGVEVVDLAYHSPVVYMVTLAEPLRTVLT